MVDLTVEQVRVLVEGGGLGPDERLPPVRRLAEVREAAFAPARRVAWLRASGP